MDNAFDYLVRLKDDLIEQFRGHPNIEVMNCALARQLQEVYDFFMVLRTVLVIDTSSGKQLDNIGDIVQLSRKEAAALASKSSYTYDDDDAMYRIFLHYKIFLNSADCTYADIMRSIYMLWSGDITYAEEPEHPATIILGYEMFNGANNARLHNIPILKPGGVRIMFRAYAKLDSHIYTGASLIMKSDLTFVQSEAAVLPLYLIDEESNLLTDEQHFILYEQDEQVVTE